MPRATYVPISPEMLRWAMDEAGVDEKALASSCGVDVDEVVAWLAAASRPTKTQFNKLRERLRRPAAVFFLDKVPADFDSPAPSFRARALQQALPKEATALRTASRIQKVAAWIRRKERQSQVDLGRATSQHSAEKAAREFRDRLGWTLEQQRRAGSASEATRAARTALERLGVLTLQFALGREACRGFSLFDQLAPVVAANSAYIGEVRLYSYFHEVGHLITRTDSVCQGWQNSGIERWCEEFAAACLMPRREFLEAAQSFGLPKRVTSVDAARPLAAYFNVSLSAVVVELIRLDRADDALFGRIPKKYFFPEGGGGGGGATSPEIRLREWGAAYPAMLLRAEEHGYLKRPDVLEYLDLSNSQALQLQQLVPADDGH